MAAASGSPSAVRTSRRGILSGGVNGLEDSRCIMEPGDLDDLLRLRRRRFVGSSGTAPGLSGTLTGVADRLRGIAHSADSRRRPLASFAPAVRPHAAPVARQGSQASVLAMGSRSRHCEGRAQLEGLQPLLARDLPMIEPRMGGEPQLRRTLPGSPINRPKCHGPTKAGKPKCGSLSQNWHQGPKGINTFTPHKAPTQPTYNYEGVIIYIYYDMI